MTFEAEFARAAEQRLEPADKRDLYPDQVPSVLRDDRAWHADHVRAGLCWLCRKPLVQLGATVRKYLGFKLRLHAECDRRLR